jgi:hypothetical protein
LVRLPPVRVGSAEEGDRSQHAHQAPEEEPAHGGARHDPGPETPDHHDLLGERCTGRIGSLVGLLRGELSKDVLAVLTDARHGLFPEPREMTLDCSCPDWAAVCKHIAAVLYGVGIRLDAKPELFFILRQVDQAELLASATAGAVPRARPRKGRRIAAARLSTVFGIDLDDTPPAGARSGRAPRRRSARSP